MVVPTFGPERRRRLTAALLSGGLVAILFVMLSWARLLLIEQPSAGAGEIALGILTGWVAATVAFAPFLWAVLIVIDGPSRRAVIGGTALVYVFDLLVTVGQTFLSDFPAELGLVVLAVPLTQVVIFLAVATAIWLAYHGGYERLAATVGHVDQHPLFAHFADKAIAPDLTLQRGLITAGLAAIVGAGGLVLAGGIESLLRAVARSGAEGISIVVFPQAQVWNVGIPLDQFPVQWLFEASFLLGVLLVSGPQPRVRDFVKGIAVIFGVQSTVRLLPALILPGRLVELWDASGPILTPLGDAILLCGIAVAVGLAYYGGLEALRSAIRSKLLPA